MTQPIEFFHNSRPISVIRNVKVLTFNTPPVDLYNYQRRFALIPCVAIAVNDTFSRIELIPSSDLSIRDSNYNNNISLFSQQFE